MSADLRQRAAELHGYRLALAPLLNKLTSCALDYDELAERWAELPKRATEMKRAAAQLRLVRDLTEGGAKTPREAALWASAAHRHLAEIRRSS